MCQKFKKYKLINRYFVHLSYKGTNFHGWQFQLNAITVQEVLDKALSLILKEKITTTGAGRTDTGVHALNFYAHFDSEYSPDFINKDIVHHLNCILPNDIAIHSIIKVMANSHARFDAISRTYNYRITQRRNPFNQELVLFFPKPLDLDLMNAGSKILLEYIDFTSFCKLHSDVKTNNCKITEAKWEIIGDEILFTISADRFLRNMVRAIVGTLLSVGLHKLSLEELKNLIELKKRSSAGMSVAAHGLHLTEIRYPYPLPNKS